MAPAAQGNDPPKTPPTATTTAAPEPDDTAPAALVPLPPGYTLGPLVVNTVEPGASRRETFTRTVSSWTGAGITCRGLCPAEALACALAEAWQHYFTRTPKRTEEAIRDVCKRPHPAPTGGLSTAGPLADRHTFQFPVCLTDTPEVVNVGERKPAPAVTVAGDPVTFNTTMRLEAVGQDWGGGFKPLPRLRRPIELEWLGPDPKRVAAELGEQLRPLFADMTQRLRDDVAAHSRAVMAAATRARDAVPPESAANHLQSGFVTIAEARERAAGVYCDPAAAVRNPVWPSGWYDGKICSRYTSRTFDATAGRTPGMVSTFIHSGPLSDLDGPPPHSGVSCVW